MKDIGKGALLKFLAGSGSTPYQLLTNSLPAPNQLLTNSDCMNPVMIHVSPGTDAAGVPLCQGVKKW